MCIWEEILSLKELVLGNGYGQVYAWNRNDFVTVSSVLPQRLSISGFLASSSSVSFRIARISAVLIASTLYSISIFCSVSTARHFLCHRHIHHSAGHGAESYGFGWGEGIGKLLRLLETHTHRYGHGFVVGFSLLFFLVLGVDRLVHTPVVYQDFLYSCVCVCVFCYSICSISITAAVQCTHFIPFAKRKGFSAITFWQFYYASPKIIGHTYRSRGRNSGVLGNTLV